MTERGYLETVEVSAFARKFSDSEQMASLGIRLILGAIDDLALPRHVQRAGGDRRGCPTHEYNECRKDRARDVVTGKAEFDTLGMMQTGDAWIGFRINLFALLFSKTDRRQFHTSAGGLQSGKSPNVKSTHSPG